MSKRTKKLRRELRERRFNNFLKVVEITYEHIKFDNGSYIGYYHEDCNAENYADFLQLQDTNIMDVEFKEKDLTFESCDCGFRFGTDLQMFFVPCYSNQNGYYATDIEIYYCDSRGEKMLDFYLACELIGD